jgi:hypothetical protein
MVSGSYESENSQDGRGKICTRTALSSAILHKRSARDSSTIGGKSHGTHLDRGWRNPSDPSPGISQLLRFASAPVFCRFVDPSQQKWHSFALQRRLRAHAQAQTRAGERGQLLRSLPTESRGACEGAQCRTFSGPIRRPYVPGARSQLHLIGPTVKTLRSRSAAMTVSLMT